MIFETMDFGGLNEEGARNYYRAKIDVIPFLNKQIISPFEDALKEFTEYNDKSIPKDVMKTILTCKDIPGGKFVITTTPTTKRPSDKDVYDEMMRFFWKGYNPVDVCKFLNDIRNFRESILDKGVKQEITPKHEELDEKLKNVDVSIIGNPEKDILIPAKGLMYLRTCKLYDNLSQYVSAFDSSLKESTGITKELKERKVESKQIGNTLFIIRATPSESVKYKSLYDHFIGELSVIAGEKPELPKTKAAQEKAIERYKEMEKNIEKNYAVVVMGKEKKPHIELKNMVDRFEKLRKEYTKDIIRDAINFYAIA